MLGVIFDPTLLVWLDLVKDKESMHSKAWSSNLTTRVLVAK